MVLLIVHTEARLCEERSDEAISNSQGIASLLSVARNDNSSFIGIKFRI